MAIVTVTVTEVISATEDLSLDVNVATALGVPTFGAFALTFLSQTFDLTSGAVFSPLLTDITTAVTWAALDTAVLPPIVTLSVASADVDTTITTALSLLGLTVTTCVDSGSILICGDISLGTTYLTNLALLTTGITGGTHEVSTQLTLSDTALTVTGVGVGDTVSISLDPATGAITNATGILIGTVTTEVQ